AGRTHPSTGAIAPMARPFRRGSTYACPVGPDQLGALPRARVISAPVDSADVGDDRSVGPRLTLVLAMGFVFAAELIAILIRTGGRMLYSLDDAYIHLRMSEQILSGTFGINEGIPASAS